jgi:primosomal protein N'
MEFDIDNNEFKCPTCGKVQEWGTACKLCGSDITQLRELAIKYKRLQQSLRENLRICNFIRADEIAQQIIEISPTSLNKKVRQFTRFLIKNQLSVISN